jgi:hypothetical protein
MNVVSNKALKRILDRGEKNCVTKDLHTLYSSLDIKMMKSRSTRWALLAARVGMRSLGRQDDAIIVKCMYKGEK